MGSAAAGTGDRSTELSISGMTCNNCARHVGEALRSVAGVQSAAVDLGTNSAKVRWKRGMEARADPLLAALHEAGYGGSVRDAHTGSAGQWSPLAGWRFNVVFGLIVAIPLMILEWGFDAGMRRWYQWLSFALVLPLQVLGGARFYKGAWTQIKIGQSNMDTLVSLGSTTAFLFSAWGLFAGWTQHLYFMDAAAILTLVSLGHFFEAKASAQAASSLRGLLQLAPETARRITQTGAEESVPVASLEAGDRIVLRAGDRIPSDGEIVEGSCSTNESMLTGEALPVEKAAGAKVYAGTINESGRAVARVLATGEATALARIIEVVEQAQSSRASIQRLGDRVSSVFVPVVVLTAITTGIWWGMFPDRAVHLQTLLSQFLWHSHFAGTPLAAAVYHAAAVLIIACPCAMGLATPVAIMAGTNVAARRGILIRDGAALEKSGRITTVLFDKTGTLTQGKVRVAAFESYAPEAKRVAAALGTVSTHPLSKAVAEIENADFKFDEAREVRGSGVQARAGGAVYRLGSLQWLKENGVNLEHATAFAARWPGEGASVSGVSRDGDLLAAIALHDSLKPHATAVVRTLTASGKQVYLVTGDNRRTAEAIAAQAGIARENVRAEVRPEGKIALIRELQEAGVHVAFAGDGINDAPALEQADLGIALTNASDIARESADIVLLKADLEAIPESIGLARATLRTIKQNLFWAFFYNALGVPLAAIGFISPVFSALAMGLSDLIVIGNALKLRWWKLPRRSFGE